MSKARSKGRCYLCRKELGKVALRNHILREHTADVPDSEACYLIRAEDYYDKNYWLYFDIPLTSSFTDIDYFLRRIWLECCGHLSEFRGIDMDDQIGIVPVGASIEHVYDFGSTSRTMLTVIAQLNRERIKDDVRFLGHNLAPVFSCSVCGQPADWICDRCSWNDKDALFCQVCLQDHEHDEMLTRISNSPRMGMCAYDGPSGLYDLS